MNTSSLRMQIKQINYGNNFGYVLPEERYLDLTEYKVIQNQGEAVFVSCMKMLLNGKIELFYKTDDDKSIQSMLYFINAEKFILIIANLIKSVIAVKENGFLSCNNIELSFDKIYVDVNTWSCKLVYLPITIKKIKDYTTFENQLRKNIINIVYATANIRAKKTDTLCTLLANPTVSLEEIYEKSKQLSAGQVSELLNSKRKEPESEKTLYLKAVIAGKPVTISLEQDELMVGKNNPQIHALLGYNLSVSREHCCISRSEKGFQVVDLASSNGTFVNQKQVLPNEAHEIQAGDTLRIANIALDVLIK